MDDLIRRLAAIDALNKMKIYRPLDSDRYVISDCLNKIVNLPSAQTADAVEVVRCGECKHMSPVGVCTYFADSEVRPSASDFCSYGERKTDE